MPAHSLIGKRLDEYQIEKLLGQGGMARIYLAEDVRLKRRVAIKVVDGPFDTDPEYIQRFEREAQAIARLDHPHIVRLYRYGEVRGVFYMAMQYIEGRDLRTALARARKAQKPLAVQHIGRILHAMGSALDYAHSRGVIHRDVKPSNIRLDRQGHSYLADFGLARQTHVATHGKVFGSVHYIAPEQAISSAQTVPQSDLYALGVILYEMLTGQPPFNAENLSDVATMHIEQSPTPPRTLRRTITAEVEAVVLRALEKQPERRFPSGRALAEAFDLAAQATTPKASARMTTQVKSPAAQNTGTDNGVPPLPPIPAAAMGPPGSGADPVDPPSIIDPPPRSPRRHRLRLYMLSSMLLAAIVLGVWFGFSLGEDDADTEQEVVDPLGADAQYDADVDGVWDAADECPDQRGLSELHGCWATGTIIITTTDASARLRGGPGTVYPVVDTIQRGAQVYIVGRTVAGDWLRIRTIPEDDAAPRDAWIAEFLVEFNLNVAVEQFPIFTPED
ncbi:MAG: protein kinase [Anaerolineae bacterium]|nr:protein kinase [Anaerolineae bacterium]